MKNYIIFFIGAFSFNYIMCDEFPNSYDQLQDIIINNNVMSRGVEDCESRFQAIKPILDLYQRPITLLDLGAAQGYFSFRIAREYPSTCVMTEADYQENSLTVERLLLLCTLNNNLNNIIFLDRKVSVEELNRLASCEHFDVILALNFLKNHENNWKKIINSILDLGDNIIIEIPLSIGFEQSADIEEYLLRLGGNIILDNPENSSGQIRGKLFWFARNKRYLERSFWFKKPRKQIDASGAVTGPYVIKSTYTEKMMLKEKTNSSKVWQNGINLLTFQMLHGVYPLKSTIKKMIAKLKNPHTDFMMWNMIIQGDSIVTIDDDDPKWSLDKEACLKFVLEMLAIPTPEKTLAWFIRKFPKFLNSQGMAGSTQWVSKNRLEISHNSLEDILCNPDIAINEMQPF